MHPNVERLISYEYAPQRSEEWLRLREGMLTASDTAAAIGDNPYCSPLGLVARKVGVESFNGNACTAHGNNLEDAARDIYCERIGEVAHEIGLMPHPTIQWLGGSPDGITETGRLLEIKCPLKRKIGDGKCPKYYLAQVQLLMEILDLEVCDFIQYKPPELTGGEMEFTVQTIPRDRTWFNEKLPLMWSWWNLFQKFQFEETHERLKLDLIKERNPRTCKVHNDKCLIDYEK